MQSPPFPSTNHLAPRYAISSIPQYKSFSSSLCNLLHSTITSSLLGPNLSCRRNHNPLLWLCPLRPTWPPAHPLHLINLRIVLSPEQAHPIWVFLNVTVLEGGVINTSSKPQAGGTPLVGCPWMLIQYIRSYPPYQRPFLFPHPEDAPCRGDSDPLITCKNCVTNNINWYKQNYKGI